MYRNGFKLCSNDFEQDSGKCFSLTRVNEELGYEIILGNIIIHPNLIYNMSREALGCFLLGKLNKKRSFKFEYNPQFNDELRICISVERNLDFHFSYQLGIWMASEVKSKIDCYFPNFVKTFRNEYQSDLGINNVIEADFTERDSIFGLRAS
jgi:hypothetical protein